MSISTTSASEKAGAAPGAYGKPVAPMVCPRPHAVASAAEVGVPVVYPHRRSCHVSPVERHEERVEADLGPDDVVTGERARVHLVLREDAQAAGWCWHENSCHHWKTVDGSPHVLCASQAPGGLSW